MHPKYGEEEKVFENLVCCITPLLYLIPKIYYLFITSNLIITNRRPAILPLCKTMLLINSLALWKSVSPTLIMKNKVELFY